MRWIRPKVILDLLKKTTMEWLDDNPFRLSASLSFFTIFSIAPLLVVVLFVVGVVWKGQTEQAQARIVEQVEGLAGEEGAELVATMLEKMERPGAGGLAATLLGIVALLFGATAVFVELQDALNTVWEVEPKGVGLKDLLAARVLSFGLIIGVGFVLLASLVVSAVLAALDDFMRGLAPGLHLLMGVVDFALSLGVITLLFAMIYRFLPDARIEWRDVWTGAFITAGLFVLGEFAIGLYLGNSTVTSSFGAAGSLAVLLLWIYYSSLIFFFGAEFTQVYMQHRGRQIVPEPHARRLRARPARGPEPGTAPALPAAPAPPVVAAPARPVAPRASRRRQVGLLLLAFVVGQWVGRRRR